MVSWSFILGMGFYLSSAVVAMTDHIDTLSQLALDGNGHLQNHWLLVPEGECGLKISSLWNESPNEFRRLATYSNDVLKEITTATQTDECTAICLERGTPSSHVGYVFPEQLNNGDDIEEISNWLFEQCKAMEIGFVSYHHNPAIIYWIRPDDGQRVAIANLLYGEQNTFWTNSVLGHGFEVVDNATEVVLGTFIAEFNSFHPIGQPPSMLQELENEAEDVRNVFDFEMGHYKNVKRTFTEFGFTKGRLPEDVWGSMQAYHYNNALNFMPEEYGDVSINYYEVAPMFLGMPWGLKGYWQTRLLDVVQRWVGEDVPLESTDIYGIRKYQDGARLLAHVDRIETHAVSLIVNIAQSGIRKPWMVEIYDHADRLHEIEMNPGDIVYYESARCLHGRMTPLEGEYYVNLFTHYRPVGDPQWYLKPNPEGTPEPVMDITGMEVPTLSPKNHVVGSSKDLFEYWVMVAPAEKGGVRSEL